MGKFPSIAAILLTTLFFLAGMARGAAFPPQTSTSASYNAQSFLLELGRLKAGLEAAGKSTEALRAYRESLPDAWTVEAGGQHYNVPTNLLVSRLVKAERQPKIRDQQVDQAREYLDALAAETSALSRQPPPETDSARSKLNAILSRREFAQAGQESWWDKLRSRINQILSNALDRILSRVGGQKTLGLALLWIGVCAAAVLIAFWIFRVWFRAAGAREMALQAAAIPSRTWQEWVLSAREAAARADYRMAIHCAYWAGIARLQDLGALAPDRAKTPREYLRALTKSKLVMPEALAGRQEALSLLTMRLEKVWYGYQAATETDFRDSLTQLETLGCHLP